jgi:hypothetical protein
MKKLTSIALVSAMPFFLSGCAAAIWGNLFVLAITVGIFVGTLSLGRAASASSRSGRSAESSTSSHG